jgi:hypothetical protein
MDDTDDFSTETSASNEFEHSLHDLLLSWKARDAQEKTKEQVVSFFDDLDRLFFVYDASKPNHNTAFLNVCTVREEKKAKEFLPSGSITEFLEDQLMLMGRG